MRQKYNPAFGARLYQTENNLRVIQVYGFTRDDLFLTGKHV